MVAVIRPVLLALTLMSCFSRTDFKNRVNTDPICILSVWGCSAATGYQLMVAGIPERRVQKFRLLPVCPPFQVRPRAPSVFVIHTLGFYVKLYICILRRRILKWSMAEDIVGCDARWWMFSSTPCPPPPQPTAFTQKKGPPVSVRNPTTHSRCPLTNVFIFFISFQ